MSTLNAVDATHLLSVDFYVSAIAGFLIFTAVFWITFRILVPRIINPRFEHIRKSEKLQFRICSSTASAAAAVCIGFVSLIWLHDDLTVLITDDSCRYETTRMQRIWLSGWGIGYNSYDIVIYCILGSRRYSGKIDYVYLIHHVVCMLIFGASIISVYGGQIAMTVIWLHEWTNPILKVIAYHGLLTVDRNAYRPLLIRFGLKTTYLVMFIVLRTGLCGVIAVMLFLNDCPLYLQSSVPLLLAMNVLLLVTVIRDLRKVYAALRKSSEIEVIANTQICAEDTKEQEMTTIGASKEGDVGV